MCLVDCCVGPRTLHNQTLAQLLRVQAQLVVLHLAVYFPLRQKLLFVSIVFPTPPSYS